MTLMLIVFSRMQELSCKAMTTGRIALYCSGRKLQYAPIQCTVYLLTISLQTSFIITNLALRIL